MRHQGCSRRRRVAGDRGIALLVALAIVAILSVVVLDFSFSVRVNMHVAANFRDRLIAMEAAKGGVYSAIYKLRQDAPQQDTLQDDWAQPWGIDLSKTDPEEYAEESGLTEEDLELDKHEDFVGHRKGGNVPTARILVFDEERKLNVNLLAAQATNPMYRQWMENLIENLEFPGVDAYELVDNITDWIDTDDDGNAEYMYYENLPEPYSCRNDLMESVYELKLVKDVTDLVFFGDTPYPMQLSGLEEEEWDRRASAGYSLPDTPPWETKEDVAAIYGLSNFLTAHSTGQVNVNTAPREVLMAIMENYEFLADTIIQAREEDPTQTNQINQIIRDVSPALYDILVSRARIAYRSSFFRVESTGTYHKAAVKAIAIVERNTARDIIIHSWRVEDAAWESSSEDVALLNVM